MSHHDSEYDDCNTTNDNNHMSPRQYTVYHPSATEDSGAALRTGRSHVSDSTASTHPFFYSEDPTEHYTPRPEEVMQPQHPAALNDRATYHPGNGTSRVADHKNQRQNQRHADNEQQGGPTQRIVPPRQSNGHAHIPTTVGDGQQTEEGYTNHLAGVPSAQLRALAELRINEHTMTQLNADDDDDDDDDRRTSNNSDPGTIPAEVVFVNDESGTRRRTLRASESQEMEKNERRVASTLYNNNNNNNNVKHEMEENDLSPSNVNEATQTEQQHSLTQSQPSTFVTPRGNNSVQPLSPSNNNNNNNNNNGNGKHQVEENASSASNGNDVRKATQQHSVAHSQSTPRDSVQPPSNNNNNRTNMSTPRDAIQGPPSSLLNESVTAWTRDTLPGQDVLSPSYTVAPTAAANDNNSDFDRYSEDAVVENEALENNDDAESHGSDWEVEEKERHAHPDSAYRKGE